MLSYNIKEKEMLKCKQAKENCHPTGWPAGRTMKVKEAIKITDSFTKTSKMPGLSYSLPAWECKTGWKLAQIPGTPCFSCYAKKGNYTRYPAIRAAQYRRLKAIEDPRWVCLLYTSDAADD